MSNTRTLIPNLGIFTKKADAAYGRNKVAVVGSDGDHCKVAAAVTDRPYGLILDGCDAAEDLLALQGFGVPGIVKMSGAGNAGQIVCPAVDGSGDARIVPATAGAYWAFGRLLNDAEDDEEAVVETFAPVLVGAQHATNGQVGLPAFASDPTGVPAQMWYNDTSKAIKAWVNGAAVTIANIPAIVLAFALLALLITSSAQAADKTPVVISNATTGAIAAAASGDNFKLPTGVTFEAPGTVTITEGALTDSTIVTGDIKDGTITAADIGDVELAALGGLTSAANSIPYFTGSGTAAVVSSSANVISLLGAANYAAMRTLLDLEAGVDFNAYDADLTTYAGITPAANVQSLLGAADYAAIRALLDLEVGVDFNAYDADLTTFAGITPAANVVTFLGAADNAAMAAIIAGAVVEGGLANSTIVTADIKDGEIVDADVNASAAIANTKLALPMVRTITQAVTVSEFTDNTDPTGFVDLSSQIPANSIVLGWKANVTSGFAGDTTAVIQVGAAGALARFSADTAQSVLAIAKVGAASAAATSYTTAATTVRVTVTGGADFTTIKTANTAAATITVYYVQTE